MKQGWLVVGTTLNNRLMLLSFDRWEQQTDISRRLSRRKDIVIFGDYGSMNECQAFEAVRQDFYSQYVMGLHHFVSSDIGSEVYLVNDICMGLKLDI